MQLFTASTTSLQGASKPVETYTTLWCADGTYASTSISGRNYLVDGSSATTTSIGSSNYLFTLSSSASPNTNYAFEVTAWTNNASYPITCYFYDYTSSTTITSMGTSATTATTIRSGTFKLTSGHQYGVFINVGTNSYYGYISDASLVTFP